MAAQFPAGFAIRATSGMGYAVTKWHRKNGQKNQHGERRFMPFVFTEQGVADFNQYKVCSNP
ncbi:MAG: ORF6N domain-containing protein [Spirochaetaceae bacterium]|nr:ORF6N domain-containing protein [Spirochaetaceae bacterium]